LYLSDQNSDDDADDFLVNSSSRTFTELTNVPILPVQVPSSSSILPSHRSSSITPSTISSSSFPRILTPSTVAKAIYNQFLSEQPPPSSSISKPSSRVRQQRKFGEVVTSDTFLNEITQKAEKKLAKSKSRMSDGVQKKRTYRKKKKPTENV
jgi:hypothetical protein